MLFQIIWDKDDGKVTLEIYCTGNRFTYSDDLLNYHIPISGSQLMRLQNIVSCADKLIGEVL